MGGRTMALKTPDGDLLGFLLLATDGDEGDCVVMTFPAAPLDRADSEAILANSHPVAGELRFRRTPEGLEVAAPLPLRLKTLEDGTFEGTIGEHPLRAEWARSKR
jgi:hypothetical protein